MLLMGAAVVMTLIILYVTFVVYVKRSSLSKEDNQLVGWEKLSSRKLYFDEIYHALFVKPIEWLSNALHNWIDQLILHKSIQGAVLLIGKSGDLVRKWQTGLVASYLFWMVIGIIGLVVYYLIKF
jgi:NADH-quinone oxidoreductase subunit L